MTLMDNGLSLVLSSDELEKFERAASETGHMEEAERIQRIRVGGAPLQVPAEFRSDHGA
jgi:hypothetical protein